MHFSTNHIYLTHTITQRLLNKGYEGKGDGNGVGFYTYHNGKIVKPTDDIKVTAQVRLIDGDLSSKVDQIIVIEYLKPIFK